MPDGYLGRNLLLKLETTTPGTFVTVGGMRSTGVVANGQMIDVTTKDDGTWTKKIGGGIKSMECSAAGVFRNDASHKRMHELFDAGEPFNAEIVFQDGDKFAGKFGISKLERSGEFDKEEIYSITLESCGTITFTEAV